MARKRPPKAITRSKARSSFSWCRPATPSSRRPSRSRRSPRRSCPLSTRTARPSNSNERSERIPTNAPGTVRTGAIVEGGNCVLAGPRGAAYSEPYPAAHNESADLSQGGDPMNVLRLLVAVAVACALAVGARADEKKADNAKLLVGTWEVAKADQGTVPVGSTVEFTKDGKMKVTHKQGDK